MDALGTIAVILIIVLAIYGVWKWLKGRQGRR